MKQAGDDHTKEGRKTLSTMLQLISMKRRLSSLEKNETSCTEIKVS